MPARRKNDTRLNSRNSGAREDRRDMDRNVTDDRHMEDREVTEDRVLTDEDRVDEFRQQFFQSALPDLPMIPGYHVCWLTTENPRDPIHARVRLGYEPIRESDIPGWNHSSLKTGEWAGCIGINEMVAFKLPIHLYEAYMRINHHEQPLEEEEKLNAARRRIQEEVTNASRGAAELEIEEGMAELGEAPEPPSFASMTGELPED